MLCTTFNLILPKGTVPLVMGYSCKSDGGYWTFVFCTKVS